MERALGKEYAMLYQIVGTARCKFGQDDHGATLNVCLELQAANDDEAKAKINQALIDGGYVILADGTLSAAHPWESLYVELRAIRPLTQIELKKARSTVLAFPDR